MRLNEFPPAIALAESKERLLELDGLRALAVVAVILFHCEVPGLFNAGYFGVDMFFTISGFIISSKLIEEYQRDGDFRFGAFYFRRLKRLLPPVAALLAMALPIWFLSAPIFNAFRADVPAALAYASNWWQILEKQSYFDTTPHVLRHLWSLAVEEQFYVIWPPLAYCALKWGSQKAMGLVAAALATASTLWMGYQFAPELESAAVSRLYLGTDTHAMGLFAGAALAAMQRPVQRPHTAPLRRLARFNALLSLAGLLGMMLLLDPSHPWMYRGCFLAVGLLTAVLIQCTLRDGDFFLARLLRAAPVQWLGSRSYSLYLVHWLVFVLMKEKGYSGVLWMAASLMPVGLLAELMYRWVEQPFKEIRLAGFDDRRMKLCVLVYFLATVSLFAIALSRHVDNTAAPASAPPIIAPVEEEAPAAPAPAPVDDDAPNAAIEGGDDIFAMGDSVLLGAQVQLARAIPGIRIDAHVGRQASQGLKVIEDWRHASGKASTVLIHLGTNGYINEGQFRAILAALADRTSVIVINVHAERRWTASNNALIATVCPDFPNVRVIDWDGAGRGHPEYFVKDGIHLTGKGIRALVAQIQTITGGAVMEPGKAAQLLKGAPRTRPADKTLAASEPAAEPDKPATEPMVDEPAAPHADEAPAVQPPKPE